MTKAVRPCVLNTRTWGRGGPVALLVHGIGADASSWDRVGPELAARGYRAVAVDLRGHGQSPRSSSYHPRDLAADLATTAGPGVALAIGHSLGGWLLALGARELGPARAVYEDPAWAVPGKLHAEIAAEVRAAQSGNPCFDPACIPWLLPGRDYDASPFRPAAPSLVIASDPGDLVDTQECGDLVRRGFAVERIPGAGHHIHRDAFTAFMGCLDRWLAGH